jgi:hypothetical protein
MNLNDKAMKTKNIFLYLPLLLALMLGAMGCSSDEDDNMKSSLCNSWMLVSYGNESNEVLKEAEGYYYLITFNPDETYSGNAYGNDMGGRYKCKGNKIQIYLGDITLNYLEGADPDKSFF